MNEETKYDLDVKRTPPVELAWQNIGVDGGGRPLLKGVSGFAKSGEVLAILGLSGSGKTTLLSVLTQQRPPSCGSVTIRRSVQPRTLVEVAFVPHDDNFPARTTVLELLTYHAALVLPDLSRCERDAVVRSLLARLSLGKAANTIVQTGSGSGGCSAGEVKRLSIALRLLHKPAVLVLDEPLSSLDSARSWDLALFLREMADKGTAVVFSLHQPRQEVFELVDKVLLLKDGKTVFFGAREDAAPFLRSNTAFAKKEPAGSGGCISAEPAHFLLDVLARDSEAPSEAGLLSDAFRASAHATATEAVLVESLPKMAPCRLLAPATGHLGTRTAATLRLLVRQQRRNWPVLLLLWLSACAIMVLVGAALRETSESYGIKQTFVPFFVILASTTGSAIFLNENGFVVMWMYEALRRGQQSCAAASMALLCWFLFLGLLTSSTTLLLFIAAGLLDTLAPAAAPVDLYVTAIGVYFAATLLLCTICVSLQGLFFLAVVAATTNRAVIMNVAPPPYFFVIALWQLVSGYTQAQNDLDWWWWFVFYSNPATWAVKAILTVFECGSTSCPTVSAAPPDFDMYSAVQATVYELRVEEAYGPSATTSADVAVRLRVISYFNLDDHNVGTYLAYMVAILVVYWLLCPLTMLLASVVKRALWRDAAPGPQQSFFDDDAAAVAAAAEPQKDPARSFRRPPCTRGALAVAAAAATAAVVFIVTALVVPAVLYDNDDGYSTESSGVIGGRGGREWEYVDGSAVCPNCIGGWQVFAPSGSSGQLSTADAGFAAIAIRNSALHEAIAFYKSLVPVGARIFKPGSYLPLDPDDPSVFKPNKTQDLMSVVASSINATLEGPLDDTAEGRMALALLDTGTPMLSRISSAADARALGLAAVADGDQDLEELLQEDYNTSVAAAMKDGRLYSTQPLPGGDGRSANMLGQKNFITNATDYLTFNARGVMYKESDGTLRTIAVQLGGAGFSLMVRDAMASATCWDMLRAHVRHLMIIFGIFNHIGAIHMPAGAVVLSTARHLEATHPVARFLGPFLHPIVPVEITLFFQIYEQVGVAFNGPSLASAVPIFDGMGEVYDFAVDASWTATLAKLGLDDLDDGVQTVARSAILAVEASTVAYATDFVIASYGSDAAVVSDAALQAWAAELCDPRGGNIRRGLCSDLPEAPISGRRHLSRVLAGCVSLSVLHSFTQTPSLIGHVLLSPANLRGTDAPTQSSTCTAADELALYGDHIDWSRQIRFAAGSKMPALRHIALPPSTATGSSDPEQLEKYNDFVAELKASLLPVDEKYNLRLWRDLTPVVQI